VPPEVVDRTSLGGPLTLIVGNQELLVSRAVARVVAAVRARDAQADVRDLQGETIDLGLLLDLTSPSLFGELRVVVVRGAQDLAEDVRDGLAEYAAAPLDDVVLVVAHSGVTKGKRLVDALTAAGATVERITALTKPGELLPFVQQEIRSAGREVTAGAARALVDAVGTDLRELAAAVAQLLADSAPGVLVDEALVARHHRGRANTGGFHVADAALAGDTAGALLLLRQAMDSGTHELVVLTSLASGLRETTLVLGSGQSSSGAIAKQLGLPPWRVERIQRTGRGWTGEGLTAAIQAVAHAELEAKGGGVSGAYAAEQAVLRVSAARNAGRSAPRASRR
jgi:DNA polymerase-3 subunit delta